MLEQQIYSIESANINQETLVAMKNAGAAMKQIHGKMTMEDVDTTMWVLNFVSKLSTGRNADTGVAFSGNNSANNTNSRRKSATPSLPCPSPSPSTRMNWRPI